MSRPKKTPVERAADAVARIPAARRIGLRARVEAARNIAKNEERCQRLYASKTKGREMAEHVALAQRSADAARDVGKLLALLDAIGGAS